MFVLRKGLRGPGSSSRLCPSPQSRRRRVSPGSEAERGRTEPRGHRAAPARDTSAGARVTSGAAAGTARPSGTWGWCGSVWEMAQPRPPIPRVPADAAPSAPLTAAQRQIQRRTKNTVGRTRRSAVPGGTCRRRRRRRAAGRFCSRMDKPHQTQTTCNTRGQHETRSCSHRVIWHLGLSHVPPAPAKTFSLVAVFVEKVKSHGGRTTTGRQSVWLSHPSGGVRTPLLRCSQAGHRLAGAPAPPAAAAFPSGRPSSSAPPPPAPGRTRAGGCSQLGLVARFGVAGAQLVAAAALAAVAIVGHVGQRVRADQVPAGQSLVKPPGPPLAPP